MGRKKETLTCGLAASTTGERERKARRSRELAGPAAGLARLGPKRDAEGKEDGPRAWETCGPRASGGLPAELG
jgi:hypothetical protein